MKRLFLFTVIILSSASYIIAGSVCDSVLNNDNQSAGTIEVKPGSSDTLYEDISPYVRTGTSDECELYLDNKTVLSDVELTFWNDSTLMTKKEGKSLDVKISEIRKIVFKPVAPFGNGYLIGSGIGFLGGFLPFAFIKPHGESWGGPGIGLIAGLILSVPCGLVGGFVGLLTSSDDQYLFDKGITPAKTKRLKYIIEKHPK